MRKVLGAGSKCAYVPVCNSLPCLVHARRSIDPRTRQSRHDIRAGRRADMIPGNAQRQIALTVARESTWTWEVRIDWSCGRMLG
jgi:hypothetical protein